MKVFMRSSGGIGNIQLQGVVDTTELSSELAQRAEKFLTSSQIQSASHIGDFQSVDGQQFYVRISSDEGSRAFEIDEATSNPELVALCNALLHEIIRRKATEVKT